MILPIITARDSAYLSTADTGLGNVLFQVASCIGISRILNHHCNLTYLEDLGKILLERFGYEHIHNIFKKALSLSTPLIKPLSENMNVITQTYNKFKHYDIGLLERLKHYGPNDNIVIDGYLECYHYFDKIENEIRELFSPDESSRLYLLNKYPQLSDTNIIPIAIHYRHCDGTHMEYYKKTIKIIQEHLKNENKTIIFFVFSNMLDMLHDILKDTLPDNTIWVREKADYMELWLMSLCHHFIIGLSTFGWWGSFLSNHKNKKVFYPKHAIDYFNNSQHHLPREDTMNNYFYPFYEVIE